MSEKGRGRGCSGKKKRKRKRMATTDKNKQSAKMTTHTKKLLANKQLLTTRHHVRQT